MARPTSGAMKGGKKNRKHNRNRASHNKCSPSTKRYTLERRWEKNKARKIAREARRQAAFKS